MHHEDRAEIDVHGPTADAGRVKDKNIGLLHRMHECADAWIHQRGQRPRSKQWWSISECKQEHAAAAAATHRLERLDRRRAMPKEDTAVTNAATPDTSTSVRNIVTMDGRTRVMGRAGTRASTMSYPPFRHI